jgi:hypothetical protein
MVCAVGEIAEHNQGLYLRIIIHIRRAFQGIALGNAIAIILDISVVMTYG